MSVSYVDSEHSSNNPLELLVEIVGANDWPHERTGLNELAVEINGRWCNYRLFFLWQEEMGALHFSCVFETRVDIQSYSGVHHLLALINEKLWLGHFDLSSEDGTPMFRHTLLLKVQARPVLNNSKIWSMFRLVSQIDIIRPFSL